MARVLVIDSDRLRGIHLRRLLALGLHEVVRCTRSRAESAPRAASPAGATRPACSIERCMECVRTDLVLAPPDLRPDLLVVGEDGILGRGLLAHRMLRMEFGPEIPLLVHADRTPTTLPDDRLLVYLERPLRLEALLASVEMLLRRRVEIEREVHAFLLAEPEAVS